MKIIAWNLGHQTQERGMKPRFVEVIDKLRPEVITLNEYVHGSTREPLVEALARIGLIHIEISKRVLSNNQVLIASRTPLHVGDLLGPSTEDGGGESNFLHVNVPDFGLEIVGVRAPAYASTVTLDDYWQKLAGIIRSTRERRIVFIGDLNADPEVSNNPGARYLAVLRAEGWNIPFPSGAWSHISGTRIDHAVASPAVTGVNAQYMTQLGDIDLASRNTATRISDHAALLLQIGAVPNLL
jgi:hypothetical protein